MAPYNPTFPVRQTRGGHHLYLVAINTRDNPPELPLNLL